MHPVIYVRYYFKAFCIHQSNQIYLIQTSSHFFESTWSKKCSNSSLSKHFLLICDCSNTRIVFGVTKNLQTENRLNHIFSKIEEFHEILRNWKIGQNWKKNAFQIWRNPDLRKYYLIWIFGKNEENTLVSSL